MTRPEPSKQMLSILQEGMREHELNSGARLKPSRIGRTRVHECSGVQGNEDDWEFEHPCDFEGGEVAVAIFDKPPREGIWYCPRLHENGMSERDLDRFGPAPKKRIPLALYYAPALALLVAWAATLCAIWSGLAR